jgi:hypothetical protein
VDHQLYEAPMNVQFPGLIKGTPLPTSSGPVIQNSIDKVPLSVTLMDGTDIEMEPSFITWKWFRSITFVKTADFTVKTTPSTIFSSADKLIPANHLKKGMVLDTNTADIPITDVHTYHVLTPVFCLLFPEPVMMLVKGVFIQFPSKTQRKDLVNEFFKTKFSNPECF